MRSRWLRVLLIASGILVALLAVYLFVMFGPPGVAERISKPTFCATCHNMRPELAAFRRGAHAKLASCNDCHLPNTNAVSHWFWDGVFGVKDLVRYNLGTFAQQPANIEATDITRRMIQENCRRCHARLVSHVDVAGRECWSCHREMYHRQTGLARDVPSGGLSFEWAVTGRR